MFVYLIEMLDIRQEKLIEFFLNTWNFKQNESFSAGRRYVGLEWDN